MKARARWRRCLDWLRAARKVLRDPLWFAACGVEAERCRAEVSRLHQQEVQRLQRRSEGARCGHPRQLTAAGDLLRCAWPGCPDGVSAPALYTAVLPPMSFRISDPEILGGVQTQVHERREAWTVDRRDAEAGEGRVERHFFWVLRSGR